MNRTGSLKAGYKRQVSPSFPMNIVQITPGGGGMYCGNCLRDNALVAALNKLGHASLMVPLYLPLTLDEPDSSAGTPIFFSGINVYLQQKAPLFRSAPRWLNRLLASRALLKRLGQFAARTRPEQVGELTLSMLRGEEGNQARELDELLAWLKAQPKPDVICLSNCLLIGLCRRLKAELGIAVVCMLQGEDSFLDALPPAHQAQAWSTLAERVKEADLCVAPSRYFADRMSERLRLAPERIRVVHNGINLDGYDGPLPKPEPSPVLGYFARMCPQKGLDTVVEAFILLKQRTQAANLKLWAGGSFSPVDQPFVNAMRDRLRAQRLLDDVEFHPNLERAAKTVFLRSLTVFSVPARHGEAFGLYVLEALAAGVPVVQPRQAAFPELIAATGGGVLCEPGSPRALADAVEELLARPAWAKSLGAAGRAAVHQRFSASTMAQAMLRVFEEAISPVRA
jgi:glycosyltransferase involved in cell wall biosynthesis